MKYLTAGLLSVALLTATAASAQTPPFATTKCEAGNVTTFDKVRLPQAVLANGKVLAAGTYQVRLTSEHPSAAVGQSPTAECWVEFVQGTAVAGREVASVVMAGDIGAVAKGPAPQPNGSRVDPLRGGDYFRVWLNSAGTNYIVNLPVARSDPR
jgi:hypothetical protein